MIRQPTITTTTTTFENGRFVRKSKYLKAGYFISLTIIRDRKAMMNGSRYNHGLFEKPRSSSHKIKSVSEATTPAAAGIGKPRNSFPPPVPAIAARQLKRANRKAPHITYHAEKNQPISGYFCSTSSKRIRCTRKAGATPNETMS